MPASRYQNLRLTAEPVDYFSYLDAFTKFDTVPRDKKNAAYKAYLENVLNYFHSYFHRALPLENLDALLAKVEKEHNEASAAAAADNKHAAPVPDEKGQLYCEACQHTFANKSVYQNHLPGKKHQKALQQLVTGPADRKVLLDSIELLEKKINAVGDYLAITISNTKRNIEKKQSMTVPEILAAIEMQEAAEAEPDLEDDEEKEDELDAKIWNPKGLPLDVTGKPIPYWLWKLHGLGVEYQCEVSWLCCLLDVCLQADVVDNASFLCCFVSRSAVTTATGASTPLRNISTNGVIRTR
jgi:splicing factor 3A subunit 3